MKNLDEEEVERRCRQGGRFLKKNCLPEVQNARSSRLRSTKDGRSLPNQSNSAGAVAALSKFTSLR